MKRTFIAAGAALAMLISGPAVLAGVAQAQSQTQQAPAQTPSYSDDQIAAYAEAVQEVRQVSQAYEPKMAEATTDEERQQVRQEATEEMVEKIEGTGVTVEQYQEITMAARNDPELAQKISGHMQE